jgi:hypothetical protein
VSGAIAALLVSGVSIAAHAQEVPERRPVQPLFGAPDPRGESEGGLSVTGSLFGSYDNNILLSGQNSTSRPPSLPGVAFGDPLKGAATGYDAAVFLKLPTEKPTFDASVFSTGRYFPEFQEYVAGRQVAEVTSSVGGSPGRYTTVRVTGSGRYSMNAPPFATAAALSSSDIDLPFSGDGIRLRRTNDLRGAAEIQREWGGNKTLTGLGGIHSSQIDGSDRHEIYEVGSRFGMKVSQYSAFRAGYVLQQVDRGVGRYSVHHLNIGGDYAKPLSASRRAFIAFSGGSAAVESRDTFRLSAIGNADFWYEFKQSWIGALRYHRGVTFIDEVADPLLSDAVSGEIAGLLSPRVDFSASTTFTRGIVGFRTRDSYQMYGARSQLRYALSRMMAVYGEYLLFHYEFPPTILITGGLPPSTSRQAVKVGLTVSSKLVNMGRRN